MADQTIPSHSWRRKKPPPPPPPPPPAGWHKRYGTQIDEDGNTVTNYQNWGRCTCEIGTDHT